MASRGTGKDVVIAIPPWIWGNDPVGLLRSAGLYGKKLAGAGDLWRVYSEEAYYNRRPNLVTVENLAGPRVIRPRIELLTEMAQAETVPSQYRDRGLGVVAERFERARATGELVDLFAMIQLHTMVAEDVELAEVASAAYGALLEIPLAEDSEQRVFQSAGLHVIRRSAALYHRAKLVSVLVRLAHDRRLQAGDLTQARIAVNSEDRFFSSSDDLYNGIILFDAYMAPLYGALTPAIWCLHSHRELGPVIYSLGVPLAGTQGEPTELLQLLLSQGPTEPTIFPELSSAACVSAVGWWADRLSDLFAVTTDPATFSSPSGTFDPMANLRALLSIEQLFRRIGSIQYTYRDRAARQVLLFTVLDTLQSVTGRDFNLYCTYSFARKTLDLLRTVIPSDAAELLLSAAERAVAALREVQDGFFLPQQMGVDYVEVQTSGGARRLNLESATAHYIKMLRDATHGHGTIKSGVAGRIDALLAHHSGRIPHDLPLLGYLYLLELLAKPDLLRRVLGGSANRTGLV